MPERERSPTPPVPAQKAPSSFSVHHRLAPEPPALQARCLHLGGSGDMHRQQVLSMVGEAELHAVLAVWALVTQSLH